MLEDMLQTFANEYELTVPHKEKDNSFLLKISDEVILRIYDLEGSIFVFSTLLECPKEKKEDLFLYLMKANLLGAGTGGSAIGLDAEEKNLTLSYVFPYEVKYQEFKEQIEDFANFLLFWKKEIERFQKSAKETIYR